MTFTPIPAPLYQRIFAVLSQRIAQGDYAAGSRFATEDELVAEFGVSKATVRRAVGELVARGQLTRKQGSGTYVHGSGEEPGGFVGSVVDLVAGTPQLKVLDVCVEHDVRFPAGVRRALKTDAATGTVYRTRRLWGEDPFVYSVHYVGAAVGAVLTRSRLTEEGLLSLLSREGVEMTEADQTVCARLADAEVAEQLNVELGAAVLSVERVLYSSTGPLDCLHSWYRGDLYRWQSRLAIEMTGEGVRVAPTD